MNGLNTKQQQKSEEKKKEKPSNFTRKSKLTNWAKPELNYLEKAIGNIEFANHKSIYLNLKNSTF